MPSVLSSLHVYIAWIGLFVLVSQHDLPKSAWTARLQPMKACPSHWGPCVAPIGSSSNGCTTYTFLIISCVQTCWSQFTCDCMMVLHAGKMVFHKHVRCMLGYTSSRALRCERPTAVPHKPRPSTVFRGGSFFRRRSDPVAMAFGKVLGQCLAVYHQTHTNETCFCLF